MKHVILFSLKALINATEEFQKELLGYLNNSAFDFNHYRGRIVHFDKVKFVSHVRPGLIDFYGQDFGKSVLLVTEDKILYDEDSLIQLTYNTVIRRVEVEQFSFYHEKETLLNLVSKEQLQTLLNEDGVLLTNITE